MKLIDGTSLKIKLGKRYSNDERRIREIFKETINDMPTIEAIPISWIEEWLKKMPKHTTPYFYKSFLRNAIRGMVKDWRKENE